MRLQILLTLTLFAGSSAAAIAEEVSILDAYGRSAELRGKKITIHGWIKNCEPDNCLIHASPHTADGDVSAMVIRLEGSKRFHRTMNRYRPNKIEALVKGEFQKSGCDDNGDEAPICLHWSHSLENPRLIKALNVFVPDADKEN